MFQRLLCVVVALFVSMVQLLAAQQPEPKSVAGQIKFKVDSTWTDLSATDARLKLQSKRSFELQLRGWLTVLPPLNIDSAPVALLDVGNTTWLLELGDDRKLQKLAKRLDQAHIVVSGVGLKSSSGPGASTVESSMFAVVRVKELKQAKHKDPAVYAEELELQVANLFERLKRMNEAMEEREIEVTLPPASAAIPLTVTPEEIIITIGPKGAFCIDQEVIKAGELETMMKKAVEKNSTGSQPVIIFADKKTPFQHVVTVMNICNRTGMRNYSVSTIGESNGDE